MIVDYKKMVDDEILDCLNLDNPKSFLLFAGAGSGKTKSLVDVMTEFRKKNSERLYLSGKKVAIITYTNAACEEIIRRLEYDNTFFVSTLHSFAWELVRLYQKDIKIWLERYFSEEISKLDGEQNRSRSVISKAYRDRVRKIKNYKGRLNNLTKVRKVIYEPNGGDTTKDSLNHAEVIKLAAFLLSNKPLLQRIMVLTYPVILIDESQDTHKELLNAFRLVQNNYSNSFSLGLFGDMAQRIYFHGESNLVELLPPTWKRPENPVNHRCPKRVIKLINKIREDIDTYQQISGPNNKEGMVRLFIIDTNSDFNKIEIETCIANRMAGICEDEEWNEKSDVKILTLEHHMAAKRGNFNLFFSPLYDVDELKTGVLDGTLPGINFFINKIIPLIESLQSNNKFTVCQIMKKESSFLEDLQCNFDSDQIEIIKKVNRAVTDLYKLWDSDTDPQLIDILKETYRSGLFEIPDDLKPIASRFDDSDDNHFELQEDSTDKDQIIDAWDEALLCPFSQFKNYYLYISEKSQFGTHQGVKGLEFPRVMVILDDGEARGHQFQYEKLLTDKKNMASLATQYLFYVTCSRTQKSLAIVIYAKNPNLVKEKIISYKWFEECEIITDFIAS
jgi:DNA helicase II / ATP-dependent DNA helicase PcrA